MAASVLPLARRAVTPVKTAPAPLPDALLADIGSVRDRLRHMASHCLNHDYDEHALANAAIRRIVEIWMTDEGLSERERAGFADVARRLREAAAQVGRLSLDDLGDVYHCCELQLAALLWARIAGDAA